MLTTVCTYVCTNQHFDNYFRSSTYIHINQPTTCTYILCTKQRTIQGVHHIQLLLLLSQTEVVVHSALVSSQTAGALKCLNSRRNLVDVVHLDYGDALALHTAVSTATSQRVVRHDKFTVHASCKLNTVVCRTCLQRRIKENVSTNIQ